MPDAAAVDGMESDIVRRRLRGDINEATAKRELFIVNALKEGIAAGGAAAPEVLVIKLSLNVVDQVDHSKPAPAPFKVTYTA